MPGKIVNEGTPPPHRCAYERPETKGLNRNTVWQCDCGKFWKLVEQEYGDIDSWTARNWILVKDAEGTEFTVEKIPTSEYMTYRPWPRRPVCSVHGKVYDDHFHTRKV